MAENDCLKPVCLGSVDKSWQAKSAQRETTHVWGSLEVIAHTALITNIGSRLTGRLLGFSNRV